MQTEQEMREASVPTHESMDALTVYIKSLVEREHDYGTSVYAMSMAAVAAFNYVAHQLGVTGFQASCADLDFIRRTRSLNGPFMLVKAEESLYPQYNLHAELDEALWEWRDWLSKQAKAKLAESHDAHPDVIAHWRKLMEAQPCE